MRGPFLSACVIAALTLGSAATAAIIAPKAASKPAPAAQHISVVHPSKRETCAHTWEAQKTHVGKRETYIHACVTKG